MPSLHTRRGCANLKSFITLIFASFSTFTLETYWLWLLKSLWKFCLKSSFRLCSSLLLSMSWAWLPPLQLIISRIPENYVKSLVNYFFSFHLVFIYCHYSWMWRDEVEKHAQFTNMNKNSNLGLLIASITFIPKDMDIIFSSFAYLVCVLGILFHLFVSQISQSLFRENDNDHI